jgi:hypothetical protein
MENCKSRHAASPILMTGVKLTNRLALGNLFHSLPAMTLRLLPVFCLSLCLTACGRKTVAVNQPPVSPGAQDETNAAPANQPVATSVTPAVSATPPQDAPGPPIVLPTQPTVIPMGADWDTTLAELSNALRAFASSTRSVPKDFQDFVTRGLIQAPPPPPGKAYAIQKGKVILVNQ